MSVVAVGLMVSILCVCVLQSDVALDVSLLCMMLIVLVFDHAC